MTQALTLTLDFAAATDIGCRRSNNEDSYGYDAEQHLYVVCDGMGGNAAGEVASGMAVRTLIEAFGHLGQHAIEGSPMSLVENRLLASIFEANRVVREAGAENPELHSMGTTLVCACLDGNRVVIGNVGDSRAYLLRNGNCLQITQDHSLLDEEVRSGNMTPEMAASSNLQSVITRAIGVADLVEPDLFAADNHRRQKLSPLIDRINDRYGRCSIGFGFFPSDVRAFKGHAAFHRVPEKWEF